MTAALTLQQFESNAASARDYLTRPLRLYDIRLPAGLHGSISVGWSPNGAERVYDPRVWLDAGFDGVRFLGDGPGRTVLRNTGWGGTTVAISRHPGAVVLEGMTIYGGEQAAVVAGEQNIAKVVVPGFALRLKDVEVVVPPPDRLSWGRAKWGVFYYQCDLTYENVKIDALHASEHGTYGHGFAKAGAYVYRLSQRSSGAEGWKQRPDVTETAWLRETPCIQIVESSFRNWYQPWSSRGGAALVLQHSGAHVLVDRCAFQGGGDLGSLESNVRSKAIMLSSESNGYDVTTGARGGTGQGYVLIRRTLAYGHSEVDWHNTLVRCAANSSGTSAALGLWVDRCGLYGRGMIVQTGNIPAGRTFVQNCNTPQIREVADARGIDTREECTIPLADRRIKVSEGLTR